MKTITVVLVDDNEKYRVALEKFLNENAIEVMGSYTHTLFIEQPQLKTLPDIAIISFDVNGLVVERTIRFIRSNYPVTKILVNSIFDDRKAIDKIMRMAAEGLVFKIHKEPGEQLLQALDALTENRNYFETKK